MDNFLDFIVVNIPCWIALLILIIRVVIAAKRGVVQEICSLIAMVAGGIAVILIAFAIREFVNQDKLVFALTIFLIAIFGLVYKLLSGLLAAVKLAAKLPVIKVADKILGVVIGIIEALVIVWFIYCVVIIMDAGLIKDSVINCVRENSIMRFLYEHNLVRVFIAPFSETLSELNIKELINF